MALLPEIVHVCMYVCVDGCVCVCVCVCVCGCGCECVIVRLIIMQGIISSLMCLQHYYKT